MNPKPIDVTALGELLIDFTQNGLSEQGNLLFEANPGGAPGNVLAMLRKLGRTCAFIGKVGADKFGDLLVNTVAEAGVDVSGILRDPVIPTTLALVHTLPGGDRSFSFYRKPGADIQLTPEEVQEDLITGARIFHFGTLSLTEEPVKSATKKAVALAKAAGCLISFDPNLRELLWDSLEDAGEAISWGLSQADIVKIADNEVQFMTGIPVLSEDGKPLGEADFHQAGEALLKQYPTIRLLNITAGAAGSYSFCQGKMAYEPAFALGGTIETTGAGDTFCACVLHYVLEKMLDRSGESEPTAMPAFTEDDLHTMLRFANAAAYLVTTKKGAIRSMPTPEEVREILS